MLYIIPDCAQVLRGAEVAAAVALRRAPPHQVLGLPFRALVKTAALVCTLARSRLEENLAELLVRKGRCWRMRVELKVWSLRAHNTTYKEMFGLSSR